MVSAKVPAGRVLLAIRTLRRLISGCNSAEEFEGLKHGLVELAGEIEEDAEEVSDVIDFNQEHAPTLRIVRTASL